MKTEILLTMKSPALRFWRCESGALSSEFAVVAALSTVLGVTFYETTQDSSRVLASGSGFVIENDGPNYSIDGSGPITGGVYASYSPEEETVERPAEEDTWLDTEPTLDEVTSDPEVTPEPEPIVADQPETSETAENTDPTTEDTTGTETSVETAETATETTETAASETGTEEASAAPEEPTINPDCILPNGNIKNNCS